MHKGSMHRLCLLYPETMEQWMNTKCITDVLKVVNEGRPKYEYGTLICFYYVMWFEYV